VKRFLNFVLIALTISYGCLVLAQEVTISIDKIQANKIITGYVGNLSEKNYGRYKVIVYVHTDRWYIHPYAGQGEGLSWARIDQDGTWQIQTVKRQFKADQVAALLVRKNYPEPDKIESLTRIPSISMEIRQLTNTEDYGKL